MLKIRQVTRREWNETPRDYKGITTIITCRHCGAWTFKSRPDLIPVECTAENGHEWEERKQRTMLGHNEKGTFLEFVEVV